MRSGLGPGERGRGRFLLFLGLVLAGVLAPPSLAHDLWLVPGKFELAASETTRVFINNGDVFPESLTLLGAHRVAELAAYGPGWPEAGRMLTEFRVDGKSLSFDFTPPESGTYLLALATEPRRVRLRAEDFEDYLSEEGLTGIAALREEAEESDRAAVERYTKWAKVVVDVAGESAAEEAAWSKAVGHPLELVPLRHPNRVAPGEALGIEVRFLGEPLPGALVLGSRAGRAEKQLRAVTGEYGRAEVVVPSPGRWHLRTIHMIRAEDPPEVEWESFWSTMTFEVADTAKERPR